MNLLSIYFMDNSMNQNFIMYGVNWMRWVRLTSVESYDISIRGEPTPDNVLLPSMGICDVKEGSTSRRNSIVDNHRFVRVHSTFPVKDHLFLSLHLTVPTNSYQNGPKIDRNGTEF